MLRIRPSIKFFASVCQSNSSVLTYQQRMAQLFDVLYFPLDELSGNVLDRSSHGFTGTPTNVTLGDTDAPEGGGKKAPKFTNSPASRIALSTVGLLEAFPRETGSMMLSVKVVDPSIANKSAFVLSTNTGSKWWVNLESPYMVKPQMVFANTNFVAPTVNLYTTKHKKWCTTGITWSKANNRIYFYFNGNKIGIRQNWPANDFTGDGLLANGYVIGAQQNTGYNALDGWVASVGLSSRELTEDEMYETYVDQNVGSLALFGVGDSKMAGNLWFDQLTDALTIAAGSVWAERPSRYAWGGYDVDDIATQMEAGFDPQPKVTPAAIVINIGANDARAVTITSEVSFKARFRVILNTLIAKWPGIPIYCARIWRGDSAQCITNSAVISGYIDDLITEYAAQNVLAGHDERVWARGADDGATMLADGVHYSAAGTVEVVNQWKAVLGY